MDTCKLCGKTAELRESHIIPRSIIKDVKQKESQLHRFQDNHPPKYSNANPTEKLFCGECEQFLSSEYEQYGTQLFKRHRNITRTPLGITFKEFDYQTWYLFLLSILWRASISTHADFKSIQLSKLNDFLKYCIRNRSLVISNALSIDELVIISMNRIVDRSNRIPDKALKNILMNLNATQSHGDHVFKMIFGGFLFTYRLSNNNLKIKRTTHLSRSNESRLIQREVPFIDITESSFLCDSFNWLIEQSAIGD